MEVQSISKQALAINQIVRAQVGTGRISLPVNGSGIYTNFKHITGIGGLKNQPGYSVNQLRNLDNLIDRLKLLKGDKVSGMDFSSGEKGDIEKLLESYREELYKALHTGGNFYQAGIEASGLSLNILV
jgi:hypothetical protein